MKVQIRLGLIPRPSARPPVLYWGSGNETNRDAAWNFGCAVAKAPMNSQVFDYSFVNLLFEENGSQIFGGRASRAADSRYACFVPCPAHAHSSVATWDLSSKPERIRNSCRRPSQGEREASMQASEAWCFYKELHLFAWAVSCTTTSWKAIQIA